VNVWVIWRVVGFRRWIDDGVEAASVDWDNAIEVIGGGVRVAVVVFLVSVL